MFCLLRRWGLAGGWWGWGGENSPSRGPTVIEGSSASGRGLRKAGRSPELGPGDGECLRASGAESALHVPLPPRLAKSLRRLPLPLKLMSVFYLFQLEIRWGG